MVNFSYISGAILNIYQIRNSEISEILSKYFPLGYPDRELIINSFLERNLDINMKEFIPNIEKTILYFNHNIVEILNSISDNYEFIEKKYDA